MPDVEHEPTLDERLSSVTGYRKRHRTDSSDDESPDASQDARPSKKHKNPSSLPPAPSSTQQLPARGVDLDRRIDPARRPHPEARLAAARHAHQMQLALRDEHRHPATGTQCLLTDHTSSAVLSLRPEHDNDGDTESYYAPHPRRAQPMAPRLLLEAPQPRPLALPEPVPDEPASEDAAVAVQGEQNLVRDQTSPPAEDQPSAEALLAALPAHTRAALLSAVREAQATNTPLHSSTVIRAIWDGMPFLVRLRYRLDWMVFVAVIAIIGTVLRTPLGVSA